MAQVNRRYYLKNEEVAMKAYADSAFTAARSYTDTAKNTAISTANNYTDTAIANMGDNYLAKNNTTYYEPSGAYNPATKKYVDDQKTQYTTMPTPNNLYENKIVQYLGASNSDYEKGYFYICVSDEGDPATYSWEQINVQDPCDCDLSNYYTKDETDALLDETSKTEIVDELPTTGEEGVIYILKDKKYINLEMVYSDDYSQLIVVHDGTLNPEYEVETGTSQISNTAVKIIAGGIAFTGEQVLWTPSEHIDHHGRTVTGQVYVCSTMSTPEFYQVVEENGGTLMGLPVTAEIVEGLFIDNEGGVTPRFVASFNYGEDIENKADTTNIYHQYIYNTTDGWVELSGLTEFIQVPVTLTALRPEMTSEQIIEHLGGQDNVDKLLEAFENGTPIFGTNIDPTTGAYVQTPMTITVEDGDDGKQIHFGAVVEGALWDMDLIYDETNGWSVEDVVVTPLATQAYVLGAINTAIGNLDITKREVVNTLPTQDISTKTIYMVPSEDPSGQNAYDEYIWLGDKWELIGTTKIDLTNYATKDYVDSKGVCLIPATVINITPLDNSETIITKMGGQDKITEILDAIDNHSRFIAGSSLWNNQDGNVPMTVISYIRDGVRTLYLEGMLQGDLPRPVYIAIHLREENGTWSCTSTTPQVMASLDEVTMTISNSTDMQYPGAYSTGQIIQYVGPTTSEYTNGYFYQVVSDGQGGANWEPVQVQTDMPITTIDYLEDYNNNFADLIDFLKHMGSNEVTTLYIENFETSVETLDTFVTIRHGDNGEYIIGWTDGQGVYHEVIWTIETDSQTGEETLDMRTMQSHMPLEYIGEYLDPEYLNVILQDSSERWVYFALPDEPRDGTHHLAYFIPGEDGATAIWVGEDGVTYIQTIAIEEDLETGSPSLVISQPTPSTAYVTHPELASIVNNLNLNNLRYNFPIYYIDGITFNTTDNPWLTPGLDDVQGTIVAKVQEAHDAGHDTFYLMFRNANKEHPIRNFPVLVEINSTNGTLTFTPIKQVGSVTSTGAVSYAVSLAYGTWSISNDVISHTGEHIGAYLVTNSTFNYLAKNNITAYTPTLDFHPATKKYVDDTVSNGITGGVGVPAVEIMPTANANNFGKVVIYSGCEENVYWMPGHMYQCQQWEDEQHNISYHWVEMAKRDAYDSFMPEATEENYDLIIQYKGQDTNDYKKGHFYRCAAYTDQGEVLYRWEPIAVDDYLKKDNTMSYTPTADYNPTTKKYVDDLIKPVVIWESNDPSTYLTAISANISASPAWQLTGLDMTPFKRIKIYTCAGQGTGTTASASTTAAMVLEMSLDPRAAISAYGGNYVGSTISQKPNDSNRLATLTCAVSADKTSFVVLRQTNLYGTAATANNDVNANVFLIEGYYY